LYVELELNYKEQKKLEPVLLNKKVNQYIATSVDVREAWQRIVRE
jgi:hypothetical protein